MPRSSQATVGQQRPSGAVRSTNCSPAMNGHPVFMSKGNHELSREPMAIQHSFLGESSAKASP